MAKKIVFQCDGCDKEIPSPRPFEIRVTNLTNPTTTNASNQRVTVDLCTLCENHVNALMDPRTWPRVGKELPAATARTPAFQPPSNPKPRGLVLGGAVALGKKN